MTSYYNRSEIISWCELTDEQQKDVANWCEEDIEDTSYVILKNEALPLSMFMRTDGIWNGVFVTSNTSAYVVKINKSGDEALVASKWW